MMKMEKEASQKQNLFKKRDWFNLDGEEVRPPRPYPI